MLTQERLKELLHYDPDTGVFTWIKSHGSLNRRFLNKEAGSINNTGHRRIGLLGVHYQAHRLVWLYVYGELPKTDIDHKDQNGSNNKLSNLRKTTHQENCKNLSMKSNNKSGFTGVSFDKQREKWAAYITISMKKIHLGRFDDISDAIGARKAANIKYGFYKNHGAKR